MGPRILLCARCPSLFDSHARFSTYRPDNSLPPGFLEKYAAQYELEGLAATLEAFCEILSHSLIWLVSQQRC